MDYNELYEYLRKEKYGEQIQPLPKNFVEEVADYLREKKKQVADSNEIFSDDLTQKKQYENSVAIFKELMLRRKKKILNLVFVASETGIMKRDFGTLLGFEQGLFERLVSDIEKADKELAELLNGNIKKESNNKMIVINQPLNEFVDMSGSSVGPFQKGELVNMDSKVAEILVSDGKASLIDE